VSGRRFLPDPIATQYDRLLAYNPVVCPSVCDAVHCGSEGWYTGQKVYQRSPSRRVPICPFRHFCCRLYRLATKHTAKTSRRKRDREFFETQTTTRVLIYSALLTVENLS